MEKNGRKLFFVDMALFILIISVFIYGKISAAGDLQLRNPDNTQEVFRAQGSVSRSCTAEPDENTESDSVQEKADAADPDTKKIALTFDDGPDPEYTPMLLAGLRERGVKATFFLLGQQIEMYPEIVEEMYADGHEVGVHSYEHVNLEEVSEEEACEQIQSTGNLIYDLTGVWPSFVRPPYGNWPSALDNDFCMVTVLWDVDPLDWATEDASLIVQRILENAEEYDIILLHDASESSV
ncbi:MAG: polysaccharide deacetylase family protein [Clostridiales bacterium]|nr:polysaccharide deacetylase family protein [Clostridiales bacterium]